ncbi:MAG: DUF2177 family protein [Micropepsaceae bacterium]
MKWLLAYGATALVFAALDFVWLTQMGEAVYRPALQELMAPDVNYPAAVVFYVVYIACVVFLAVRPAVQARSLATAFVNGAVLGLCAYATYDLTNMATLKVWPMHVAALDVGWGTVLTAIAAAAGYLASSRAV